MNYPLIQSAVPITCGKTSSGSDLYSFFRKVGLALMKRGLKEFQNGDEIIA